MTINANIDNLVSNDNNKIKAYATVEFDEKIKIHDVKVIEGKNGLFASMPQRSYENKDGKQVYKDIVTCDEDIKEAINKCVIAAYESAIGESEEADNQEVPFDQTM